MSNTQTAARAVPQCFKDHNAPESVRVIFTELVNSADTSANGRILVDRSTFINPLTHTAYSQRTVYKALQWLITHRLAIRTATGKGRGNHSTYFIRWSFTNPTISQRQSTQNAIRRTPHKVVTSLPIEEQQQPKPLKTASVRLSPGRIMGMARKTLNQHPQLSQTQRRAMLDALGKLIFSAGYLDELRRWPHLLTALLKSMAHRSPLSNPNNPTTTEQTYRQAFTNASALFLAVIAKDRAEMTQARLDKLPCPEAAGYRWNGPTKTLGSKPAPGWTPAPAAADVYDPRIWERQTDNRPKYDSYFEQPDNFYVMGEMPKETPAGNPWTELRKNFRTQNPSPWGEDRNESEANTDLRTQYAQLVSSQ